MKVEWGGSVAEIADTVLVDADLKLAPVGGRPGKRYPGQRLDPGPLRWQVGVSERGEAGGDDAAVDAELRMARSGVNEGDRLTNLNVDLAVRDLGEYDQLLKTLGFSGNGRTGAKAIPVNLHGTALFHGTASGEIAKLDVKGHLQANNLEVRLGDFQTTACGRAANCAGGWCDARKRRRRPMCMWTRWWRMRRYTPQGLAVASSTITQATAVLHVEGSFKAADGPR